MKEPDYMKKVQQMKDQFPRGVVTDVHVYHDDDCPIFRGFPCNCDPDIRVEPK